MELFELDQLSGFSVREAIVKPIICYKCDVINDTLIGRTWRYGARLPGVGCAPQALGGDQGN